MLSVNHVHLQEAWLNLNGLRQALPENSNPAVGAILFGYLTSQGFA